MKRMGFLCCLACGTALGCGGSGTPSAPSAPPEPPRLIALAPSGQPSALSIPFRKILCFGDSITYGVTLKGTSLPPGAHTELALVEGYVPKLWRRIEEKYGTGYELVNAGLGGERTIEGVDRIRYEMRVHDPDLVLLLEGIVDINNSAPRFPVVRDNLALMMNLVLREGRQVIIGTYPLLNPDGFRTMGFEFVHRLNDVIRQEANKQSVPVADHQGALDDLSGQGPDGLHPNNIGYEAMADTWLAAIEELAETVGGT